VTIFLLSDDVAAAEDMPFPRVEPRGH
jgi:hypothetical protein